MPMPATTRRSPAPASKASICRCSLPSRAPPADGTARAAAHAARFALRAPRSGSASVPAAMLPTLRRIREPFLFAAALAAPLLPEPFSFGLLLGCGLLWLGQRPRPPRREAALAALLVAVAVAALAGDAVIAREERLSDRRWVQGQAPEYRRAWEGLRAEAAAAAGELKRRPASPLDVLDHPPEAPPPQGAVQAATLAAFDRLGRLTPPAGADRHALLLIDRDGNAVAWAGEGLVHEPEQWPRS